MSQDPIVKLAPRDCELLNSSIIPYEEIRFLHPRSDDVNPTFLDEGQDPIPVFKNDGRAIYRAVLNRLPVMVKEVPLRTAGLRGAAEPQLPTFFTAETDFTLTQQRQLREVIIGLTLPRHGNLCQVIAWARSPKPNHFLIITERFDDDLDNYIARIYQEMQRNGAKCSPGEGGPLGWEQFFLVATELASALDRLAKLRRGCVQDAQGLKFREDYVVHRDLKLANLFLVLHDTLRMENVPNAPRIKTIGLGDFGLARIQDLSVIEPPTSLVTSKIGTLTYQPPEVIDPDQFNPPGGPDERLTTYLDIFSYGVILWRLLHYPRILSDEFKGTYKTGISFQMAVAEGKVKLPFDPSVPEDLKDIIARCCQHKPSSRPKAEEIRQALFTTAKCCEHFKESKAVRAVTNLSAGMRAVPLAAAFTKPAQVDTATVQTGSGSSTAPVASTAKTDNVEEVAGAHQGQDISSVQ
jgi:serine/threonine protein kinase